MDSTRNHPPHTLLGQRLGTAACLWLAACLLCVSLLGCKSTSASGAKVTATTVIQGHGPIQVLAATKDVFVNHGYEMMPAPGMSLVFEKKGGAMDKLLYGNWFDVIHLRAKVKVVEVGPSKCAIDCVAFYVRNRNEGILEEEISRPSEGPYQKILEEVKKSLATPDPAYSIPP